MAKHWKSYLPDNDHEKDEGTQKTLQNINDVADLPESFKELMKEKERLEQEMKALSGTSQDANSRFQQAQIATIDQKRRLDKKWESGRKTTKKAFGLKNSDNKRNDKTADAFIMKLPQGSKKLKRTASKKKEKERIFFKPAKKINKGLSIAKNSINKVASFENKMDNEISNTKKTRSDVHDGINDLKQFSKKNNLEIEMLDKVSNQVEKAEKKIEKVENVLKKAKDKKDVIKRYVKKADEVMKSDFVRKASKKRKKEEERKGFNVDDALDVIDGVKKAKKLKDDWMSKRDSSRAKSKKTEEFKV